MITIKSLFYRSYFARNVITLMTGSIIAQTIPLAILPILTRIYAPKDFGILALFLAISSFISIVITGQYESAVMLPKNEEDAINIVALALIITFSISFITLLIIWSFNHSITTLLDNDEISRFLYLIPITLALSGMYQTFNFWITRKKQFKKLATSRVSQAVGNSSIKLGMGLMNAGSAGLIGGAIGGQICGTSILGCEVWKNDKAKIKLISLDKIRENAIKYQDFPKYNAPQGFLDMIRDNGIVFIITACYSLINLGFYSLAMSILGKPMTLIGSSVSQVFYQKASETYNQNKNVWEITKATVLNLALIAIPIFLILVFYGPVIFSFVFGEKWIEAGVYAQILSPWFILRFITSPISNIPLILNKQKAFLLIGTGYNLLVPSIFLVFSLLSNNIKISFVAVSIAASAYLFGILYWIRNIIEQENSIEFCAKKA